MKKIVMSIVGLVLMGALFLYGASWAETGECFWPVAVIFAAVMGVALWLRKEEAHE